MKLVKIGHCGGYEMTRNEVFEVITPKAHVYPMITKTDAKKFLILQGNTRINGYLWVIQCIVKKYKRSDVVAVADNMSVYAIG